MGKQKAIAKLRRDKERMFSQYMRCIGIIIDEAQKLEKRSLQHERESSLNGTYEYYSLNESKILREAQTLRFLSWKLGNTCDLLRELTDYNDSFNDLGKIWKEDGEEE